MIGMEGCIFCSITSKNLPAHIIWEDEYFLAFLSIYPNTEGVTVVISKKHYPSYLFELEDDLVTNLVLASKKVAKLLDSKLEDVGRTGMIFEGFGVDHIHAKLYPMHGTKMEEWNPIESKVNKYFIKYEGYLSSHDYERESEENLDKLAKKIRG